MKKFTKYLLIGLTVIIMGLLFCFNPVQKKNEPITDIMMLNNKFSKIGVLQGAASMYSGEKFFPKSQIKYFNEAVDAYMALESGKVDAVMQDNKTAQFVVNNNEKLYIYPKEFETLDIVVAVKKGNKALLNNINDYIDEFMSSGMSEISMRYWLSNISDKKMPEIPEINNSAEVLKVGTNALIEPYSYIGENGNLQGSDIEFAKRLGVYMGRKVQFSIMNFSELITALETGKIDVIVANLNATEERAKAVDFSKPYVDTGIIALIRRDRANVDKQISTLEELKNKKIAIITGSVFDDVLKNANLDTESVYFNNVPDILISIEQDKIAGAVFDLPVAKTIERQNNKVKIVSEMLQDDDYAWVLSQDNEKLRNDISQVIAEMRNNGTIQEIDKIWFGSDESKKVIPDVLGDNKHGVLRIALNACYPPFAYIKDNKIVGYDVDLLDKIGKKLGYGIELQNMDFSSEIPSVVTHKSDIAVGGISITEERKKSVLFTEPVYNGGVVVLVKNTEMSEQNNSLLSSFKRGAYRTFKEENRYKLILDGLNLTIVIALLSIIIGTVLGFVVCFMRRSKKNWINVPAKIYISIIQGVPILVLLMVLYYIIFAKAEINPVVIASIAFGLDFAAYASEMFRSGIDAVDKGQIEAAGAMGFNKYQTFMKITLPQALKHILPVYRGEVISTIKITSIVGYIAIQDLTKMSDIIRSRTYEAFFPLISTAVIYFILAYLMAELIKIFEFKINPLHRKRVVKGIEIKKEN